MPLTKVFLRTGQMALLQSMRLDAMNEAARKIQRATQHFLFTRHRKRVVVLIQTQWRGNCVCASYQHLRRDVAATTIHVAVVLRRDMAATTIQAAERGQQQRLRFLQLRHAALVVQAAEASWQAELAPPRKKTDVAIETICMMTLPVMRLVLAAHGVAAHSLHTLNHTYSFQECLAFHSLSPRYPPAPGHTSSLSLPDYSHLPFPFSPTPTSFSLSLTSISTLLSRPHEKAEKSRENSERQLAKVRAELERTKKEPAGKAREVAQLLGQSEKKQQWAEQAEERLEEMLREQVRERAEGRERVLHVACVASHNPAAGGAGGVAGALSSLPSFGGSGFSSSSSSSPSAAVAVVATLAGGAQGGVGRAGAQEGNLGVPEGSRILARMASRRHPSPHTPAKHPTSGGGAGMAAAAAAAMAAMDRMEGAVAAVARGGGTRDGPRRGHGGAADAHHLPCIQESTSWEEGKEKKVAAISRTSSGGSASREFCGNIRGLRHVRFPSMGLGRAKRPGTHVPARCLSGGACCGSSPWRRPSNPLLTVMLLGALAARLTVRVHGLRVSDGCSRPTRGWVEEQEGRVVVGRVCRDR
ncbi:unnamed protein product [Closterium sp. Naga37s-1]|nr:unnamed protein product [Closterium sp. Naga37s-1]